MLSLKIIELEILNFDFVTSWEKAKSLNKYSDLKMFFIETFKLDMTI